MQRFEAIYEEHRAAAQAYVRRRAPEHLVDDVVSETFLVCLGKLDRVPPEPLPWLYAVARKTLANERRRRARQAPVDVLAPIEPQPAGDEALAADNTALTVALTTPLTASYRHFGVLARATRYQGLRPAGVAGFAQHCDDLP